MTAIEHAPHTNFSPPSSARRDAVLREMGEWAALGFYEGCDLPWPRACGLALRRMYEHMAVRVPPATRILPVEPFADAWLPGTHPTPYACGGILTCFHSCGLTVSRPYAESCKQRFPRHADFIDWLVEDLESRLPAHQGGYTHSNPDIRRVVAEGFDAMEAELDEEIAAVRSEGAQANPREENLLRSLKDYTCGVRTYHQKSIAALREAADAAAGLRREELTHAADALSHAFRKPARTFYEGLLAINLCWLLDFTDSIGRVDQVLGPLYEADLAAGRLTEQEGRALLDEWFHRFEALNGWNLQIGGRRPDGQDGCNRLTRELILACERNCLRRPNVAFRITADTPADLLVLALRALRRGSGRPALYNDDLYIETLRDLDLGLTPEDAREISFGGCTETMIGGMSNVGSLEGSLNLAVALERALHDGCDPRTGRREGPATGAFCSFSRYEAFEAAIKEQIRHQTDAWVAASRQALRGRMEQGDPKLYRTFFTRDCVRNRASFEAGGARFNWALVSYQGVAVLTDSLYAIRHGVFETGQVTADELLEALRADFEGHEALAHFLRRLPKYGTDCEAVDRTGAAVLDFAWRHLAKYRTPRGGRYLPSVINFATYAGAGEAVGATPDGRRAGTPLDDSVGPHAGRDTRGPAAMLHSVLRMPLRRAIGTPVLNLRLGRNLLETGAGLAAAAALVRAYFNEGGLQIQLSVVSQKDLRAARDHPEDYGHLLVRLGGYSDYFTRLGDKMQESILARCEHDL